MNFYGVGLPEVLLVIILALIVVGPQRLPQVAAQLGRFVREIRRYTSELSSELGLNELRDEFMGLGEEVRDASQEIKSVGSEVTTVGQEAKTELKAVSTELKGNPPIDTTATPIDNPPTPAPEHPAPSPEDTPHRGVTH